MGDALRSGADTLVTVGAIQSNHTRQTAAAAARCGLRCALLHCAWTRDAGPEYQTGRVISCSAASWAPSFSSTIANATSKTRARSQDLVEHLRQHGRKPYPIPGGASEHPLGSMGYVACASEILQQSRDQGLHFDYVVHCTGSGSTQAGLVAGFAALGTGTRVIGVSDDNEVEIKRTRALRLANETLETLDLPQRVGPDGVEIVAATTDPYGVASKDVLEGIQLLARSEGLMADPVYEGKAVRRSAQTRGPGTVRTRQPHPAHAPGRHPGSSCICQPVPSCRVHTVRSLSFQVRLFLQFNRRFPPARATLTRFNHPGILLYHVQAPFMVPPSARHH